MAREAPLGRQIQDICTFVDLRAETSADAGYTFLADGEVEAARLSYGQLDRAARALAARLQARPGGIEGERVLLLFPAGLEFIVAFFACLYAGAIAVPAYPPRRRRIQQRLQAIVRDARPAICLTTPAVAKRMEGQSDLGSIDWISVPEWAHGRQDAASANAVSAISAFETELGQTAEAWRRPTLDAETLAFLQYTSGSTGDPKGVRVTHGHLLHNEALIQRAFGTHSESVVVGWLPLYHDMGLIGNVLQPLYAGAECVLMSPMSFLRRPGRWLEAVSRHHATISGGPNFAYDLCVERLAPQERERLDLSSWRVAFNGAEPVRAETLQRFAAAFEPSGFDPKAFFPCYGLAEATLFVSGSLPGQGAVTGRFSAADLERDHARPLASTVSTDEATLDQDEARELVASGVASTTSDQAATQLRVEIVDPERHRRLPAGRVGEIWVAGSSVADGYWRRPEQSAEEFAARLRDEGDASPPFLRTGDLGFLDAEGSLYVTGRRKDLILIHGRNLYPHDLERVAETAHPHLRPGGSAAFLVDAQAASGRQDLAGLVLVLEVDRRAEQAAEFDSQAIDAAVRQLISEEFEVALARVVLIRAGTLPKTSSGKVRRSATRQALLADTLTRVDASPELVREAEVVNEARSKDPAHDDLQSMLQRRVARLMAVPVDRIDPERPLLEQGLDSLRALQLVGEVETELGVSLSSTDVLDGGTLAELTEELAKELAAEQAKETAERQGEQPGLAPRPGEAGQHDLYPLSHGQEALWFLHRLAPDSAAYNIAVAARLHVETADFEPEALRRALLVLVTRHDALRSRFEDDGHRGGLRLATAREVEAAPERFVDFEVLDAAMEQPGEQEPEHLARLLARHAAEPFDLTSSPLLRVRLLPLTTPPGGAQRWALLWVVHHAVADFWSLALLLQGLDELLAQPAGISSEKPASEKLEVGSSTRDPQDGALRYVDYAHWQRRRLARDGEDLAAWWLEQLGPAPPQLDILPDRPRPPVQSFQGAQVGGTLAAPRAAALEASARTAGATLYMALLTAWQTVLDGWSSGGAQSASRQRRVLIGSPTTGREHLALRQLVGYCVQPVVLDGRLEADDSWRRRLERARSTAVEAFRHADYPFELLVQRLQPRRQPDRPPIFQAWLALQQVPPVLSGDAASAGSLGLGPFALGREGGQLRLAGMQLDSLPLPPLASQFELSLLAAWLPSPGDSPATPGDSPALGLSLVYDAALFDATTAARMLAQVRRLLELAPEQAERDLRSLSLLGPGEAHQLLHEWNDTGVEDLRAASRSDAPLLTPIADTCRTAPDAIALVAGHQHLSRTALAQRVDTVASALRSPSVWGPPVTPEEPIGLFFDRGPEMVIAVLAVLAAGGAYLPLDPAYPAERLAYMAVDAGVRRILTRHHSAAPSVAAAARELQRAIFELRGEIGGRRSSGEMGGEVEILSIEGPIEEGTSEKARTDGVSRTPAGIDSERLAYVLYTSGSTGRPKGVQISRAAASHFLDAMAALPLVARDIPLVGSDNGSATPLGPRDSWLAVTTLAFDIAGLELFLPLRRGARLVLASSEDVADGARLASRLAEQQCTVLQATPATWRLLLESGWTDGRVTRLCGGEALPASLAGRLTRDGARLWNLYGPTETTIWSAARLVPAGEEPVRVGGPLANTDLHLMLGLDSGQWRRAPLGVPGEVTLGGAGLARGYRGRPGLTAARFLPHPFAASLDLGTGHGARFYRVGDLARRKHDGSLEFLGRLDQQVKLRGFRIELGEIEAALEALPAVAQGVVALHGEGVAARLVAYWTSKDVHAGDAMQEQVSQLRDELRRRLPDYMLPSTFVALDSLPLTDNGKVDRRALQRLQPAPAGPTTARGDVQGDLERRLRELWRDVLASDEEGSGTRLAGERDIGRHDNFFDLGGHSLLVARLQRRMVDEWPERNVQVVDLFRHPTLAAQAELLRGEPGRSPDLSPDSRVAAPSTSTDVAIIGMAGRFPGAQDVDAFWRMLEDGVEAVHIFSDAELRGQVPDELLDDPDYVPARGVLDGAEAFDAAFFGYTPREAEILDPQHRLFLECAWHALEHAGYVPGVDTRRCGLYAGVGMNTYLLQVGEARLTQAAGGYQAFIANDKDFVPTRVSYQLDLRGPSVNVQTACSSSLTAVHLACRALAVGDADMALAGGVTVRVPQQQGYRYEEGGILSPDGHCRPFDAEAAGTVLGNGLGVVVLKPLERALADRDTVLAVIKGSAINNDGALKMGYTAPGVEGQAAVITSALEATDVDVSTLGYVETHGTGTRLGDPIEISALRQAFETRAAERGETLDAGAVALGAVKSNIGHLDTAAGIAGLIKTVQALRHRRLPPTLHFERANPELRLDGSPFRVQDRTAPWPAPVSTSADTDGTVSPRRAGISSFGIGGTNVHVVLEEAPTLDEDTTLDPSASWRRHLLPLSARTPEALDAMTHQLGEFLSDCEPGEVADVAYTLQVGRKSFGHRRWLTAPSSAAVEDPTSPTARALLDLDPEHLRSSQADSERHGPAAVVFLLSGQGSQYPGMGRRCYEVEPTFRRDIDQGAARLAPQLDGLDLRDVLWGSDPASTQDAAALLRRTRFTQPALVLLEVALGRLWRRWGVQPAALLGHSIGELAAACLSGVFSFDDALWLAAERGRLMDELPAGAMLGVGLPEAQLAALLERHPELDLAALNGPEDGVVAGPQQAIEALEAELAARGHEQGGDAVRHRRLHTSHAFHSRAMSPAASAFASRVEQVARQRPQIPFLSNVSGTWIRDDEALDPAYWGRQLASPVRFEAGVETVLRDTLGSDRPLAAWLEVGPGRSLVNLVRSASSSSNANGKGRRAYLSTLPHPKDVDDEDSAVVQALGGLWAAGAAIDWAAFYHQRGEARRRRPVPGYAFQRRRFWLGPESLSAKQAEQRMPAGERKRVVDPLEPHSDVTHWFYAPTWTQLPTPQPAKMISKGDAVDSWLVLTAGPRGQALATRLQTAGRSILVVTPDRDLGAPARFLQTLERAPRRVVHAWDLDRPVEAQQDTAWKELLALLSALTGVWETAEEAAAEDGAEFFLLSQAGRRLQGTTRPRTEPALLAGLLRALPAEVGCRVRWVDVAALDEDSTPSSTTRSRTGSRTGSTEAWDLVLEDLVLELETPFLQPQQPQPQQSQQPHPQLQSVQGLPIEEIAWRDGERWQSTWRPLPLGKSTGHEAGVPVRAGGTYLVTGGFGGVGTALAQALADLAGGDGVRLLLLGRPPEAEAPARVTPQVDGAEVVAVHADVADLESLTAALQEALGGSPDGQLDGVIHAAGVAGGGALSVRQPEAAAKVLRPKVAGVDTLASALDALDLDPDFVLLCSSINGVVGGYGQADYAAANAYLDAWAEARAGRRARVAKGRAANGSLVKGTRIVSLAWDRWAGVGMSARPVVDQLAASSTRGSSDTRGAELLGTCLLRAPERDLYRAVYRPSEQWVLAEHEIAGRPTVPGATYLEMARAALYQRLGVQRLGVQRAGALQMEEGGDSMPVFEARDFTFLEPLAVSPSSAREVWTLLEVVQEEAGSDRQDYAFRVLSRPLDGGSWHTHVQGQVSLLDAAAVQTERPAPLDLDALRTACARPLRDPVRSEFLVTGLHWQAIESVHLGQGELMAHLRLPPALGDEAATLPLHPSLLDIATGFAQLAREGDFLPLAYERLRLFEPSGLGAELVSHVRLRERSLDGRSEGEAAQESGETLRCDVVLTDLDGQVRATVEGFAMQGVRPEALARLRAETRSTLQSEPQAERLEDSQDANRQQAMRAARAVLDGVIDAPRAAEVLARVLGAARVPARVVVSPRPLDALAQAYGAFRPVVLLEQLEAASGGQSAAPGGERPDLDTAYVAPADELQQVVAEVWRRYLAIDRIGVHDNFFELGGTSLIGVQVVGELRRRLGREIATVSLFEAPTVAALARLLAPADEEDEPAFTATRQRAERKKAALARRGAGRGPGGRPAGRPARRGGGRGRRSRRGQAGEHES